MVLHVGCAITLISHYANTNTQIFFFFCCCCCCCYCRQMIEKKHLSSVASKSVVWTEEKQFRHSDTQLQARSSKASYFRSILFKEVV
ncbi:unnamed protein product [Coffea canephora]|uniref:Uncharacterized protein n=1 Tax=Coffea canephora TaxID=49390 RepID=A0A068TZF0_COFCA|nr:unnamed protein product [Coffea canephora]